MLKIVVDVPVEAENEVLHALRLAPSLIGRVNFKPGVSRYEAAIFAAAFETTISDLKAVFGADIVELDIDSDLMAEAA